MKPFLHRLCYDVILRLRPPAALRLDPDLLARADRLARRRGVHTEDLLASLLQQELARQETHEEWQHCWASLTARERQVAMLLRQGLSSAEIAGHLVLSQTTVKSHLQHVAKKFGVRTRAELLQALEDVDLR